LHADFEALQMNSEALAAIAEEITLQEEFSHVLVERKYTSDGILAGLTIDWRHLGGWSYYSAAVAWSEHNLRG
jgi:hypothetical protein